MYVPLFTDFTRLRILVSTDFTVIPAVTGPSPCFSQKIFRAIFPALSDFIFFRSATFFDFFRLQMCPAFKFFFLIFCSKLKCLVMYFGTMRLFKIVIFRFFRKLKKIRNFFVSKGSPSIYLIFCNKLDFQNA